MSLDRTPSPQNGGGWSTPGLTMAGSTSSSPNKNYGQLNENPRDVTWANAKARSAKVNNYPAFSTQSNGFFSKNFRKLSISLPRFSRDSREKDKPRRTRWPLNGLQRLTEFFTLLGRLAWRFRLRFGLFLLFVLSVTLFYVTPLHRIYRRASIFGGGNKFVIILAANQGGGVMEWKGAREWAIERDSVRNKKHYVKKWGYDLEVVDMATKKRYAHEWRESWEKVDFIRRSLHNYPHAEWFWWLDLNTFIMEPSYSLQSHIFNDLKRNTYRNINEWNPLNITHPLTMNYLDNGSRALNGDDDINSINMIVPQDCGGFNLGSFFLRRSAWTERLLDIWWDPVHYEQKHMEWEHKEQDAFEYLYKNQPWIRAHTAFISQRKICSFPNGACGEKNSSIHYDANDRDFVVNMAGCQWGRDCWGEMYNFRELSNKLNRNILQKIRDTVSGAFKNLGKTKEKAG